MADYIGHQTTSRLRYGHHRRANGTTVQRIAFLHNTQHCLPEPLPTPASPNRLMHVRGVARWSQQSLPPNLRTHQHRLQRQLNPLRPLPPYPDWLLSATSSARSGLSIFGSAIR